MNKSTYHIFFKNLANPLRMRVIQGLKENPCSVTELSQELNIEQSKLSHALSALKRCKIVNSKQKGKQRIYSLNKKTILPMLKLIDTHSESFCDCSCCENKFCGGRR